MVFKQVNQVLKNLHQWLGNVDLVLAGGEPFLNQDLIKIVKSANQLGFKVHLNTNGYLVTEKKAKAIIKAGIREINVSIDGIGRTHDKTRGKIGAFKEAERAIEWFKKYQGLSKKGFELGTTTILMKTSFNQLTELVRWGEKIELNKMYFQVLWENFGCLKHDPFWFQKSSLWPEYKKAKSGIQLLKKMKKKSDLICAYEEDLNNYLEYFKRGPVEFGESRQCYVGISNFNVFINGDVRLCYYFNPIGNVLVERPEEIWNSDLAQAQRVRIQNCKRGCKMLRCNKHFGLKQILERTGLFWLHFFKNFLSRGI